jgi:hypothetical protein
MELDRNGINNYKELRRMDGLNEADLLKIKEALEKNSLKEAIRTLEKTLDKLGYKRVDGVSQFDIYLASTVDASEWDTRIQPKV